MPSKALQSDAQEKESGLHEGVLADPEKREGRVHAEMEEGAQTGENRFSFREPAKITSLNHLEA